VDITQCDEFPDGTVLVWRTEEPPGLGIAARDDRLAAKAHSPDFRWWTPAGRYTWDGLVAWVAEAIQDHPGLRYAAMMRAWVQPSGEQESAGAMLARVGTDAQLWARAFVEHFGGDEGTMIGWFANALEVGREAGRSRAIERHYLVIDTVNKILERAPQSWDDDTAADHIAVQYVRELERRLDAAGITRERCAEEPS
jgi:hypothetical protein